MGMLVYLNVGGVFFATSRDTLRESDSFFSGLVQNECCHEYFVDRDPTHFRHVLNWLRGGRSPKRAPAQRPRCDGSPRN